jgi:hypothetical protein
MSITAPDLKKTYFLDSKNLKNNYTYIYEHSDGTEETSEKNILYFELYRKDKFLIKYIPII